MLTRPSKHILVVSQFFWPETFRINDLVEGLERRGHTVTVLTGEPNYPEGRIFEAYRENPKAFDRFGTADVIRVPVIPRGQSSTKLLLNYASFPLSALLIGLWKLRGRDIDAILVFQTSPVTAALPAIAWRRLTGAPLLMWILDVWPDTLSAVGIVKSPRLLDLVGRLVRFIYAHCDRILVQSRAFMPAVAKLAGGTERIRYLPGWPDAAFTEEVQAHGPQPELMPFRGDFKIVFAGNIGEAQDFPAILDAAAELRDVERLRWIIIGDGRAGLATREEIRRRGLQHQVVMLGRFPLDRMPSLLGEADALLVSLRREPIWSMTIPGKVQAYLAAGVPILAMLDGEGGRIVEESRAGLVAAAGDSRALAENVRRLIAMSSDARAAMGASGLDYCAREFDRDKLVEELEGWIDEVSPKPAAIS